MRPSALHLVPVGGRGGGARAARNVAAAVDGYDHEVVVLRDGDIDAARGRVAGADVVHLHYWNAPEVQELLRGPWPPARLVVWAVIGGGTDPQWIHPQLVEFADSFVACSAHTPRLAQLRGLEVDVIEPLTDPERMAPLPRTERDHVTVGYYGTVEPLKLHPRFVELCLAVDAPVRFVVCGDGPGYGDIRRRVAAAGATARFDFVGDADPATVLAGCDLLGYPLCPDNYSGTDLVLQEAMFAGVPAVVLPYGGAPTTVTDGVTGIVARDEGDYPTQVARLSRDAALRRRLGAAARAEAAERWTHAGSGRAWRGVYDALLAGPKRERRWPAPAPASGAEAFVASLGPAAAPFRASLDGDGEGDREIAAASPVLGWGDGGVLDYRRFYPADPHLRLWAGLVLAARGRRALAAGELSASVRAGIPRDRVDARLADVLGTRPVAGGS
jgi:glycosyltransferase involved in cell wall biosynthesis